MKVVALKRFLHDRLGEVAKGREVEVTPEQLQQLLGFGWVRVVEPTYETKVVREVPADGPKKRGRPRKN